MGPFYRITANAWYPRTKLQSKTNDCIECMSVDVTSCHFIRRISFDAFHFDAFHFDVFHSTHFITEGGVIKQKKQENKGILRIKQTNNNAGTYTVHTGSKRENARKRSPPSPTDGPAPWFAYDLTIDVSRLYLLRGKRYMSCSRSAFPSFFCDFQ